MNPAKVNRKYVVSLTDLPNIGKAMAADLRLIGIDEPGQLRGRSPYELYERLCDRTGFHQDPCVLDTFISIVRFMDGEEPRPWYAFTAERKRTLRPPTDSRRGTPRR